MQENSQINGIIMKGIGGFYYVKASNEIYECKARGLFRKKNITPLVGDFVQIEVAQNNQGFITKIQERKNQFIRPPVANVDQFIAVCALANPQLNYLIMDKLIVMGERNHADVVLCFNKADIADLAQIQKTREIYKNTGYPMVFISTKGEYKDNDLEKLKGLLRGKKSVFTGPSGVGKSSIINTIHQNFNMEIGGISEKTKRGKHTTRHVELLQLEEDGYVFDTPGFTSFEILEMDAEELKDYFSEFFHIAQACRYKGCNHMKEPACAIKKGVDTGEISEVRYASYVNQFTELTNKRRKK